MTQKVFVLLTLAAVVVIFGCEQKQPGDSSKTGKVCHIVGGPHDGKQGRYDREGACCDADSSGDEVPGGWGCTGCGGKAEGKCKDGPKPQGGSPFARLELALGDLPLKFDAGSSEQRCTEPKPDDIGCTTLCKPCKIWICIDGEWDSDDFDWSGEICDGFDIDLGDDPAACPRTAEGFCPAECSFCF